MMKRILLIFSAVIMTTSAAGQDLEISVAPTVNFPVYKALEGGAGHNPGTGFSITFGYLAAQKQFIAWTIGLGYHFVRIKTDPMFNGVYDPLPYTESCSLISFSIGAVSNLRNNFFIAFGPAMDLQLNQKGQRTIERQTGLGFFAQRREKYIAGQQFGSEDQTGNKES